MIYLFTLIVLCACHHQYLEDGSCDPRQVAVDEIRARPLLCGDEAFDQGGLRRGDWILENHWLRIGIREVGSSLSTVYGSGGSLVDLAQPDHQDVLEELQPWLNGAPLEVNSLQITVNPNRAIVSLNQGELEYHLEANSKQLEIRSHNDIDWQMHPLEHSWSSGKFIGDESQCFERYTEEDVEFIAICDALEDPLHSSAEGILMLNTDDAIATLPVINGTLIWAPPERVTHIMPQTVGCPEQPKIAISELNTSALDSVNCQRIPVEIYGDGLPIAAILHHEDGQIPIPKNGGVIGCQNQLRNVWISAGAEFEERFETRLPCAPLRTNLERIWPDIFGLRISHNARDSITDASHQFQLSVADGQDLFISAAEQNIRINEQRTQPWHADATHLTGLITSNQEHWMLSFPWYPNNRQAGKGALHPERIPAPEWSIIGSNQQRTAIVSLSLLEISERPADFVWLDDPEDVLIWLERHRSLPTRPIGPQSWIEKNWSQTQLLQALQQGKYSTGTGPALRNIESDTMLKVRLDGLYAEQVMLHTVEDSFALQPGREWSLESDIEGWLWVRNEAEWALIWIGEKEQH